MLARANREQPFRRQKQQNHSGGSEAPSVYFAGLNSLLLVRSTMRGLRCFAPRAYRLVVPALVLATTIQVGCVRRRMTIRSNPAGALVYVDEQPIGVTPVSAQYTYYATRNIRLVKDGYETQILKQRFRAPWYQWPPLDFVSENLWPFELRDERSIEVQMIPQQVARNNELLERGEAVRNSHRTGVTVPLPQTPPTFLPTR